MTDYRDAGVNIEAGDEFVRRISPLVRTTFRPEVLGGLGGFGGMFRFPSDRYRDPVLVSGTDGVGTKLKLAFLLDIHDTIGIDLVAMCVNDILVSGAEPLFFLDYLAVGQLSPDKAQQIVQGIVEGCRQAGCALIGGETAEMPSMYHRDEYDVAGFAVGVVERASLIDGRLIQPGDVVIGLGSTGLHSNGYSLARRALLEKGALQPTSPLKGYDLPVGQVLLTPTKIYVNAVLTLAREFSVHGMAHITGGGLTGNLPRILPQHSQAVIDRQTWPIPPVFAAIQHAGSVHEEEMYRVFNMGIGFVMVVAEQDAPSVLERVGQLGETGFLIGRIHAQTEETPRVVYQGSQENTR